MASIYIIDTLRLNRLGLQVQDEMDKWVDLHRQQGDLDGACVVYSILMAMLCGQCISGNDIDIYQKSDKRTHKGKFLSHLLEQQGLIREGYYLRKMSKEINEANAGWSSMHYKKKETIVACIDDFIGYDVPVVISVENSDMSHAILAIGVEYVAESQKVQKIFCLDPSCSKAKTAFWNCIIDVSRKNAGEYPYWYITDDAVQRVQISEALVVEDENVEL